MIAQFQMHVRVVVEDDSAYKMDNARCRGLIKYVGKGTLFGLIGGSIQDVCHCAIAGHGCTISNLVSAILEERQMQISDLNCLWFKATERFGISVCRIL